MKDIQTLACVLSWSCTLWYYHMLKFLHKYEIITNPMDSVQCYLGLVALIFPTGQEIKLSMAKLHTVLLLPLPCSYDWTVSNSCAYVQRLFVVGDTLKVHATRKGFLLISLNSFVVAFGCCEHLAFPTVFLPHCAVFLPHCAVLAVFLPHSWQEVREENPSMTTWMNFNVFQWPHQRKLSQEPRGHSYALLWGNTALQFLSLLWNCWVTIYAMQCVHKGVYNLSWRSSAKSNPSLLPVWCRRKSPLLNCIVMVPPPDSTYSWLIFCLKSSIPLFGM